MAVTIANTLAGVSTFICTVIATADADVTAIAPHGLATTPLLWGVTQVLSQALTALSAWAIASPGATNLVGTKLASTGSGNAGVQCIFWAMTPHSIIR
jgi:hypothetical protein